MNSVYFDLMLVSNAEADLCSLQLQLRSRVCFSCDKALDQQAGVLGAVSAIADRAF